MKQSYTIWFGISLLLGITFASPVHSAEGRNEIDWNRARALLQKSQRGESLTATEQEYLARAKRLRAIQADRPSGPGAAGSEPRTNQHFTPLTELSTSRYKGADGGLYGGGRNEPPAAHLAAAKNEAAKVRPLDPDGQPVESGKIVLLAIGMSNTTQEFSRFKQMADADPQKSPHLVIVDGAQGGQSADVIATESAAYWRVVDERLKAAGVSPQQVQVVWLKQAVKGPTKTFPENAKELQDYLGSIVGIVKKRYPNVCIAYLSSRIYAGYAAAALNPEPHAYESAFAVRGLIQEQISGSPNLNYDPARNPVSAPLLLWGPYLWADGTTPRAADGLIWEQKDFAGDGTHPGSSGRQKVAEQLLKFFKTEATARNWFLSAATN